MDAENLLGLTAPGDRQIEDLVWAAESMTGITYRPQDTKVWAQQRWTLRMLVALGGLTAWSVDEGLGLASAQQNPQTAIKALVDVTFTDAAGLLTGGGTEADLSWVMVMAGAPNALAYHRLRGLHRDGRDAHPHLGEEQSRAAWGAAAGFNPGEVQRLTRHIPLSRLQHIAAVRGWSVHPPVEDLVDRALTRWPDLTEVLSASHRV